MMNSPVTGDAGARPERTASRRRHGPLLLIAAVTLINFCVMPLHHYRGDALFVQAAAVGLINNGALSIPPENLQFAGARGQYYHQNTRTGLWYSKYGVMNTLMYMPPLLVERMARSWLDYNYTTPLRILLLNAYNLLLASLIAVYLWKLAAMYTRNHLVVSGFVLLVFYSTFSWYYLRAHGFEIFQLLFFTGCCYHFLAAHRCALDPSETAQRSMKRHLCLCSGYLICLCLTKLVFVLLIPLLVGFFLFAGYRRSEPLVAYPFRRLRQQARTLVPCMLLPLALLCVVILLVNQYKFGSPLNTGYRQWSANRNLFSGNLFTGLSGYLFHSHKSVFLYFPLLPLAAVGLPRCLRKWSWDFLFVLSVFAVFLLVNSKFCDWKGSWGYGPRYLLFVLPCLSLPLVVVPEVLASRPRRFRTGCLVLVTAVLVYSTVLQVCVNSLEGFAPEEISHVFSTMALPEDVRQDTARYLARNHYGTICRDVLLHKTRLRKWRTFERIRESGDTDQVRRLEALLESHYVFSLNYYWLPRPQAPKRDTGRQTTSTQMPLA